MAESSTRTSMTHEHDDRRLLPAVTSLSMPQQHVSHQWKVVDFKKHWDLVDLEKDDGILARLPFEIGGVVLFGNPDDKVSFSWVLKKVRYEYDATRYLLCLGLLVDPNVNILKNKASKDWPRMYVEFTAVLKKGEKKMLIVKSPSAKLLAEGNSRHDLFEPARELSKFSDSKGTLTLEMEVKAYLKTPEWHKTVVTAGEDVETALKFSREEKRRLETMASLLGNKKTSDVTVTVVNEDGEEMGRFYCHSPILGARSSVFQTMLMNKEFAENKSGILKIKDVSAEVVEQFLTYLYSGRFKDNNKKGRGESGGDSAWVQLLPQLVYIADKYDVKDLIELCDGNLHRAVSKTNVAEIFKVAKRHGLLKAQAKLKEQKYMNLLVESVSE